VLEPEAEGKPSRRLALAIGGREGGEGNRLVRGSGPGLLQIPAERLQDFPRDVASFRFRELARFDLAAARRLELVFQPADEAEVTIAASLGDDGWSSTPESVEPAKLATLVDELSRLRASRILADSMSESELREHGLAPPGARLRVLGEDGALAEVEIGKRMGSDGVVARAGGASTVYLLGPTVADYLPVDLDALRNRFLVKPEPAAEGAADASDAEAAAGAAAAPAAEADD
jgi:hypothetical protein